MPPLASVNELVFPLQLQVKNHWCWAAAAVSITKFYQPTSGWNQCDLVDLEFETSTCCQANSVEDCNRSWRLDWALKSLEHFERIETGPTAMQTIKAEIDAQRPVGVRIGWGGSGDANKGHFPVITGYLIQTVTGDILPFVERFLTIQDPEFNLQFVPYDTFCSAYRGSGTWTHTFFTKG